MAKKFKETYPDEIPSISSIQLKTADGINTINSITKENNNENSIEKTQQELMNEKGFKMVGKKGHAFPMLQPDPVEEQKKKMMEQQGIVKPENRAGSAQDKNVLVNDPNNPQPANKVSANVNGREQMFNNMASNPGQPYPDASTTPPAPIFPNQQGSFAAYANPNRVREDLSGVDVDTEGGLKGMMSKFKEKRKEKKIEKETKVGEPVSPKPPKLKKPLFKEPKVSENPPQGNPMYDGPGSQETPKLGRMSMNMYDGLNLTASQEKNLNEPLKAAIEAKEADGTAMHHGKALGMHEQHTQISKANVNSAMRDDAAHASYLKRDINYDNKHGGSKKQMTADEKHISKLAGDIKYDVKKKRKYDNV